MKEAVEDLTIKNEIGKVLDLADKKMGKTWKHQALNSSYFLSESNFQNDGMQNYLVFQLKLQFLNINSSKKKVLNLLLHRIVVLIQD